MKKCVICDKPATVLADNDSIRYQNGMPVCDECFDREGLWPHEARVV